MSGPEHAANVLFDRRKLLLGLFFGSSAAVAAWRTPTKPVDYLGKATLETLVPKVVGPWQFVSTSGLVVPPEDQLSQALYSDLLTRVYSSEISPAVMLLVAQSGGQTGILQVHRPEVCYPAGGYQLSPVTAQVINIGGRMVPTNRLTATLEGQEDEHILYWTRIGTDMPDSWSNQRISVAKQNLRGLIPDAVLFRISIRSMDAKAAFKELEEFVRLMIATIPASQQRILIV
jgi:EpsI family protein